MRLRQRGGNQLDAVSYAERMRSRYGAPKRSSIARSVIRWPPCAAGIDEDESGRGHEDVARPQVAVDARRRGVIVVHPLANPRTHLLDHREPVPVEATTR